MKTQNMKVICPHCGAGYDFAKRHCPYCGTLTPEAAEAEFMDSMEVIKDDMEALPKKESVYWKDICIGQLKRVLLYLLIGFAGIAILFIASKVEENSYNKKLKEEIINEASRSSAEYEKIWEKI